MGLIKGILSFFIDKVDEEIDKKLEENSIVLVENGKIATNEIIEKSKRDIESNYRNNKKPLDIKLNVRPFRLYTFNELYNPERFTPNISTSFSKHYLIGETINPEFRPELYINWLADIQAYFAKGILDFDNAHLEGKGARVEETDQIIAIQDPKNRKTLERYLEIYESWKNYPYDEILHRYEESDGVCQRCKGEEHEYSSGEGYYFSESKIGCIDCTDGKMSEFQYGMFMAPKIYQARQNNQLRSKPPFNSSDVDMYHDKFNFTGIHSREYSDNIFLEEYQDRIHQKAPLPTNAVIAWV